jgi:glyoxylase-like metal-dependent hydrolase (beta-lactamase superfamily II)
MELEQISSSVWAVTDGSTAGNVGCIRLADRTVVIDTSTSPATAAAFRELVEKYAGTPITDVILTHYHGDHVFGAQAFNDCRIIASEPLAAMYPKLIKDRWSPKAIAAWLKELAKTDPEGAERFKGFTITLPSYTFKDSMSIGEEEAILIQHTGGHTEGQSIVYFKPERVLFASDLIFHQTYVWAGDHTNDPRQWMRTFEEILEMPIEVIVPGHGPICDKEVVRKYLAYFQELEIWIESKIQENLDLEAVLKQVETSPTPPYTEGMDRPIGQMKSRLIGSISRWFEYYKEG